MCGRVGVGEVCGLLESCTAFSKRFITFRPKLVLVALEEVSP